LSKALRTNKRIYCQQVLTSQVQVRVQVLSTQVRVQVQVPSTTALKF